MPANLTVDRHIGHKRSWTFAEDPVQDDRSSEKRPRSSGIPDFAGLEIEAQPCLRAQSLHSNSFDQVPSEFQPDDSLLLTGVDIGSHEANNTIVAGNVSGAELAGLVREDYHDVQLAEASREVLSASQEVCFGMLPDIEVRFNSGFGLVSISSSSEIESNLPNLQLSITQTRCDVLFSGKSVAVMNTKTFRSLAIVKEEVCIRLEGMVSSSSSLQRENTSVKKDSRYCLVDLLAFGTREDADLVAESLATNGFYLQEPDHIPPDFTYENPQCLKLPNIPGETSDHIKKTELMKKLPKAETIQDQGEDLYVDYDRLLDEFARHDDLAQATATAQVSTPLLCYQREGLDFIFRREMNSLALSRRLWQEQEADQAEAGASAAPIYRHIITGARSRYARECGGGILADEMGLGKSLTILSAISGSLGRAFTYARTMTNIDASGNGLIAAKSTLIVVPSALLIDNWIDEVARHIAPGALSYHKFYGKSRNIGLTHLLQNDIVFTTYGTIAAGFSQKRSLLHMVHWYRIVLDEAHVIRNASTKQFSAVTALQCCLRWCLTGTPIQNSLRDLGSLVRFLKVPILDDAAQFKRHVIAPIEATKMGQIMDYSNLRTLLGSLCLRRTRAVLPIAEVTTCIRELDFTPEERSEYARIEYACKEALDLAVSGHSGKEAHQNVLEILLRLRIFCNNGSIFERSAIETVVQSEDPEEALSLLQQTGRAICHYCSCDIASMTGSRNGAVVITSCHNAVCSECVPEWKLETSSCTQCPICGERHPEQGRARRQLNDLSSIVRFPSKIQSLCEDIDLHKNEGKCIVFSFWRRTLDIVQALLDIKNISYLRVDGSVPFSNRKKVLSMFHERDNAYVLLMTLGTGAVGLNKLSVAHRVHLIEPQWNPSIENQAIGRVVRMGQKQNVTVVRYIMNRTVEKNVQNKQFRKLRLSHGGFTHGKSEETRARLRQLRELILQDESLHKTPLEASL